jgi:hypothetical protein
MRLNPRDFSNHFEPAEDLRAMRRTDSGCTRSVYVPRNDSESQRLRVLFARSNSPWRFPVQHPPGSEERVQVMQGRDDDGLPIFHPDDAAEWSGEVFQAAEAVCEFEGDDE